MKFSKENLTATLQEIAHELHTQDNLATEDPIYCVQERVRKSKHGRSNDVWVNVQFFLTRDSAKNYAENRGYRHCGPLRVYAESAHANFELRAVRQYLMEMFPSQDNAAKGEVAT